MNIKWLTNIFGATLLAIGLSTVQAAPAPDELVKSVSGDVIDALEANKDELANDPNKVYEIVDKLVLPHFDFKYMSQLVLAQNWRKASDAQQDKFAQAFRDLLVKTYSNSLKDFGGEEVEFLPFRSKPEDKRVTVSMEIIPKAGPSVPVDYKLVKSADTWKVFDVNIDGLSLVNNYRRSFANEVKSKGLDALIARLESRSGA